VEVDLALDMTAKKPASSLPASLAIASIGRVVVS
jgi:hypothetical protein